MSDLLNAIHLSRFDVDAGLKEYKQLPQNATIDQIANAIYRLEKLHTAMTPIIKKKFDKLSALASRIVLLN